MQDPNYRMGTINAHIILLTELIRWSWNQHIFYKGPKSKYFKLGRPYTISAAYCLVLIVVVVFFKQSFKNVNSLSSQAGRKQVLGVLGLWALFPEIKCMKCLQ